MTWSEDLTAIVARFVDGQPFLEFWREFMSFVADRPEPANLSAEAQAAYEDLYEQVYMGQPDPVAAEDYAVGLRGEAELRARLREFRLPLSAG